MENMNTLEAYENLKKVNFSDEQSREIVRMFVKYYEAEPASKKDLTESETNVRMELKNTELRLQKEIEGVRLEIEDVKKETQDIRLEIKNTELRLQKEIEGVKLEIQHIKVDFIRWLIGVAIASLGLILTGIRFFR